MLAFGLLILLAAPSYAGSTALGEQMDSATTLSSQIASLSELRTQAMTRVRLLRGLHDDGEIDDAVMRTNELQYEDARAAFNAWLDGLRSQLLVEGAKPSGAGLEDKLAKGAEHAQQFIADADTVILGEPRGVVESAMDLASRVIEAGTTIVRELLAGQRERREQVVSALDDLRWPAFGSVE